MSLIHGNLDFIAVVKTKIDKIFLKARFTNTGYRNLTVEILLQNRDNSYLMLKQIFHFNKLFPLTFPVVFNF